MPEHNQNVNLNVQKHSSKYKRVFFIILGIIAVLLGLIGIVLPILPTTPFLLLGAAIFARSSDKFYEWLVGNKLFGIYIKNYREGNGVPLNVKVSAISFLWITILSSAIFFVSIIIVQILLILVAIGVTYHVVKMPGEDKSEEK